MGKNDEMLEKFNNLVNEGMNLKNTVKAFTLIGVSSYDEDIMKDFKIYADYLPKVDEYPFTEEQRNCVTGAPTTAIRKTRTEGKTLEELNHFFFKSKLFQE